MSHQLVILGLLSSCLDGTEVFSLILMMSCCDMFDLTILESLISIILGYFRVSHWESMGIVIYFGILYGCSLRTGGNSNLFRLFVENHWILWFIIDAFSCLMRTVEIIMIIIWFFPVACGELMWIMWIIFWFFSITCIWLRWFFYDSSICDFMSLG